MLRRVAGPTPQNRNASALHALRRLSTIASALSHHEELFPDDVSTRGDVDACSRASRAAKPYFGAYDVFNFGSDLPATRRLNLIFFFWGLYYQPTRRRQALHGRFHGGT